MLLHRGITGLLAVYDGSDNLVMRFEGAEQDARKMVKDGPGLLSHYGPGGHRQSRM